jgi:hypothetical protein
MQNMAEGGPIYKGKPVPLLAASANWTETDENLQAQAFAARSSAVSGTFKWITGRAGAQGTKKF